MSRHRAVARVSLAALAFTVISTISLQESIQAGPERAPKPPAAILPQNIGAGIPSDAGVVISFDEAMDPASVEAGLQLLPHQPHQIRWSDDRQSAELLPLRLWRTDERYVVVIDAQAARADGAAVGDPQRFSFTTETAPTVTDFQVRLAGADLVSNADIAEVEAIEPLLRVEPDAAEEAAELEPTTTAQDVSASSAITISFSGPMDRADVEPRFAITPAVDGELTWEGDALVFAPTERLVPGTRYTISLVGVHDVTGNRLGGKSSFTFIVRPGAQLIRVSPGLGETNVEPEAVSVWFSQPMDRKATHRAFQVVDITTETVVAGRVHWNAAGSQLTFTPDEPFAPGRPFEVRVGEGTRDADGNPVTRTWTFATQSAPSTAEAQRSATSTRADRPAVPPPAPASDLNVYALNQINAARAAYGFAPVTLDAAISAVAYAHAYDQAANGYFSHTSRDGRTREDRLRGGGVAFTWSGENQCYLVGRGMQGTLDWCHAQFMSEPYPGHFNHIANILNPNARRVGVGIAEVGGRVVITWNFTN